MGELAQRTLRDQLLATGHPHFRHGVHQIVQVALHQRREQEALLQRPYDGCPSGGRLGLLWGHLPIPCRRGGREDVVTRTLALDGHTVRGPRTLICLHMGDHVEVELGTRAVVSPLHPVLRQLLLGSAVVPGGAVPRRFLGAGVVVVVPAILQGNFLPLCRQRRQRLGSVNHWPLPRHLRGRHHKHRHTHAHTHNVTMRLQRRRSNQTRVACREHTPPWCGRESSTAGRPWCTLPATRVAAAAPRHPLPSLLVASTSSRA